MGRCYPHLSFEERRKLADWRESKMPIPEIADRLGRAPSTKVNVTSLVERVSCYAVVIRNEVRQSKPIMEALIQGLTPLLTNARQSITFYRGTEFSA